MISTVIGKTGLDLDDRDLAEMIDGDQIGTSAIRQRQLRQHAVISLDQGSGDPTANFGSNPGWRYGCLKIKG